MDVGMVEYYLLEDRSGKCRGSNHMGKATVIPSQDDENTFTINFVSGDHYKVRRKTREWYEGNYQYSSCFELEMELYKSLSIYLQFCLFSLGVYDEEH